MQKKKKKIRATANIANGKLRGKKVREVFEYTVDNRYSKLLSLWIGNSFVYTLDTIGLSAITSPVSFARISFAFLSCITIDTCKRLRWASYTIIPQAILVYRSFTSYTFEKDFLLRIFCVYTVCLHRKYFITLKLPCSRFQLFAVIILWKINGMEMNEWNCSFEDTTSWLFFYY